MPGTTCAVQKATCSVSEEVVGVAVEHHAPDRPDRHQFLGHQLGGVQDVETESGRLLLGEDLQSQFVLGERAALDAFPEIATVVVRIGARDLDGFVPAQRVGASLGRPVELDEHGLAVRVDQAIRVNAEALHRGVRTRDRAVAHDPQQHVGGLGHQRDEVPERVVRAGRLGHLVMRLRLDGVHQVGKLHRVLDEEDRNVVADQVPVAFVGVELDGEAADVARGVLAAAFAGHGREPDEHRRALARLLERRRLGEVGTRCLKVWL